MRLIGRAAWRPRRLDRPLCLCCRPGRPPTTAAHALHCSGSRQEVGAHGAECQWQAAAGAHARATRRHRQGAQQAFLPAFAPSTLLCTVGVPAAAPCLVALLASAGGGALPATHTVVPLTLRALLAAGDCWRRQGQGGHRAGAGHQARHGCGRGREHQGEAPRQLASSTHSRPARLAARLSRASACQQLSTAASLGALFCPALPRLCCPLGSP